MRGIYKIVHKGSGKYYLGSSMDIEKRWEAHKGALRRGSHHSLFLQRSWNVHGADAFFLLVVEELSDDEKLRKREQEYLDALVPGEGNFNMSALASGGDLLTYHPNKEAIVARMRMTMRKRYAEMSTSQRQHLWGRNGQSNSNYGKRWTTEQRQKAAERRRGIPLSIETRAKLSAVHKARWSNEMRENKRQAMLGAKNPFYGKTHTPETCQRLREANAGKMPANARRVSVDGVEYKSLTCAAAHLKVVPATVLYRIRSANSKFSGYYYLS